MFESNQNISASTKQITTIVKLFSLLFSAIAFSQYYFMDKSVYELLTSSYLLYLSILVVLFTLFILLDGLDSKGSRTFPFAKWIHTSVLIIISFASIMLTGMYLSNYKFLFLFIIISSSIELGIKVGLSIAGASAFTILAVDLLSAPADIASTYFESDIVLTCAFFAIAWIIGFYVKIADEHILYLKALANIDGLTGLYNHRHFYESLHEKIGECNKNSSTLSLLFIDIDYFKYYNDVNGHQKGDEALITIADELKEMIREQDIAARYGGEEFAVILPDTSEQEALEIAEKIRQKVEKQVFPGEQYLPHRNLTISLGVSVYPTKAKTEDEIIRCADEALYRAKFFKKNRVEAYSSILDDLKSDLDDNDKEIITSIRTLIAVINAKDKYTFRHVERVVAYSKLIADKLGFDDYTKKIFIYGAYMHDIGKINIPEEILMKSNALEPEEWEVLQTHPESAAEIIKNVSSLKDVVPIIVQHHERYDGTGYPYHLKGEQISYLARILNIIDSFDAMTSYRPYQKKKSFPQAFEELMQCSGNQFDPEIVPQFIAAIKEAYEH